MYLLNLVKSAVADYKQENLHSTMYLLNQSHIRPTTFDLLYLHSTMYLLNPFEAISTAVSNVFTFHYVSIKSDRRS